MKILYVHYLTLLTIVSSERGVNRCKQGSGEAKLTALTCTVSYTTHKHTHTLTITENYLHF